MSDSQSFRLRKRSGIEFRMGNRRKVHLTRVIVLGPLYSSSASVHPLVPKRPCPCPCSSSISQDSYSLHIIGHFQCRTTFSSLPRQMTPVPNSGSLLFHSECTSRLMELSFPLHILYTVEIIQLS